MNTVAQTALPGGDPEEPLGRGVVGLLAASATAAFVSIAVGLLGAAGDMSGAILGLILAAILLGGLLCSPDRRANRIGALAAAGIFGIAAAAIVMAWGDRGVSLLLVAPLLAGALSFGDLGAGRSRRRAGLRDANYMPALSGVVALGPTFAAGVVLVGRHDLSGSALAALLVAPWVFLAPTARVFFDTWSQHAFARGQAWRLQMEAEGKGKIHSQYGEPPKVIGEAITVVHDLTDPQAPARVIKRLERAKTAAAEAYDGARSLWLSKMTTQGSDLGTAQLDNLSGGSRDGQSSFESDVETYADMRLPAWIPRGGQRTLKQLAYVIGPARQLNTPLIESICLYLMLWLRAGLILGCPSFAYASFSPYLPHRYATISWSNSVWLLAAFWALGVALAAPVVVSAVMNPARQRFRDVLLGIETPLVVALLILKPSWPTAVFLAGPLNWAERPRFSARNLWVAAAILAASYGLGVATHPTGWTRTEQLAELLIAAVVLAVVATSYGLMFPLVLRAVVALPLSLRRTRLRIERSVYHAVAPKSQEALGDAERALESLLSTHGDDDELREAIARLQRSQKRLRRRPGRFGRLRRAWTFKATLDHSLDGARIFPIGHRDEKVKLNRWGADIVPMQLGSAELSLKTERHLATVMARIADEAIWYGRENLKVYAALDGSAVQIVVVNDIRPDVEHGEGDGDDLIRQAIKRLPEGNLINRGPVLSPGLPFLETEEVFEVRFQFSASALRFPDVRSVA